MTSASHGISPEVRWRSQSLHMYTMPPIGTRRHNHASFSMENQCPHLSAHEPSIMSPLTHTRKEDAARWARLAAEDAVVASTPSSGFAVMVSMYMSKHTL